MADKEITKDWGLRPQTPYVYSARHAMITVHHLDNSRSQRVLWLLEELTIPYALKLYKRQPNLLAPPELTKIHPLGKSPVITDDAHPGRAFAETGAIMDYILTRYGNGRLVPSASSGARLDYTYWMYASEGTFMTPLLLRLITTNIKARAPFLIRPIAAKIASTLDDTLVAPNLAAHQNVWEDALTKAPWFAGLDFSAADIMMSFPVEAAAARAGADEKPRLKAWLETIHARPAYRRALDRGGPYAYA